MRDINFFSPYIGKKKQMKNSKIYIYGLISIASLLIKADEAESCG